MILEDFTPMLLVVGVILMAPRSLFGVRWFETLIVVALAFVLARYLHWRLWETVWPADLSTFTGMFVWFVFICELLSWLDAGILFSFLLRRTNQSPVADWHEDRLRDMDPMDLPEVDVFIATFNEPFEVLEKTIAGAAALDWPAERLNVWVLDDGRRDWLRQVAERKGIGYLTREDNRDAKAGNINAAVQVTDAPFILVLDADFIPQRNFLYRAMGFFDDPRIGIVQIPHNFFNADPMQTSLNMSKVMPDDQRFFFEVIMPGRDGYDCAFCCGSNGIIRRSALEEIGNALPSGSITEDMLLTLALKRRGYITRYLNEPLAFGLAPESINAFFIQRARWARGGIQIMFLRNGPLGIGGLRWFERLYFLPLHWITQTLVQTLVMATPALFLITGIPPLLNTSAGSVVSYQIPTIVAAIAGVRLFAPGQYHPFASLALSVLMAFRLLPVVVATLLKPHGHAFKVTPKGRAGSSVQDNATVIICFALAFLTGIGLLLNAFPQTQHVPFSSLIPVVTFWSILNMIVLLLVAKIANSPPVLRDEERIWIDEPAVLHVRGERRVGQIVDMSLTGALITLEDSDVAIGDWVGLQVADVGLVPGRVARSSVGDSAIGLVFRLPSLSAHLQRPDELRKAAARHPVNETACLIGDHGRLDVDLREISEFGAGVGWQDDARAPAADDWVRLELPSGNGVPAQLKWVGPDPDRAGWRKAGLQLHVLDTDARDLLIEKLFTEGRALSKVTNLKGWTIFWGMLAQIFARDAEAVIAKAKKASAEDILLPPWLQNLMIEDAARPVAAQAPDPQAETPREWPRAG